MAFFEIAVGVFDFDGGVVDEDADGECEATEGHDVDGLADEAEDDDGGEDGERDGDGDDEGRAPGAEEEKDHQAGERGGDDAFANDAVDGGADEDGLITDGGDLEFFGDGGCDAREQILDALYDAECGGGAGLEDGEQDTAMAILTDDVGLRNGAVGNGGDVFEVDRCAIDLLERKVSKAGERGGSAVEANVVFGRTDLCGATGLDDVLIADGGEDFGRREAFGLKFFGVEVHHDRTLATAVDAGDYGAGNGDQLRPDDVHTVVVELLLTEALAGESELENGHAGRGEIDDLRRENSGREVLEHLLGVGGDLGVGGVEGRAGLQVDFDDVLTVEAGRFDVLDVIDEGGEGALVGAGDAAFDLFGAEAGVLPGNGDNRDIDVREDIGGCPEDEHRRSDQDEDREDDEGIGPVKRKPDNPHEALREGERCPLYDCNRPGKDSGDGR